MKVDEKKLTCCFCLEQLSKDEGRTEQEICLTKCHHIFHKHCLEEGLLENADLTTKNLTKAKLKTKCPEKDCEENITHKLKSHGRGKNKTYEIINLESVSVADFEVLKHLLNSEEETNAEDKEKEATLEEKNAFQQATMILSAVFTATLAGIIFQAILPVVLAGLVGYGLAYLGFKSIEFISKIDFEEMALDTYNYIFS